MDTDPELIIRGLIDRITVIVVRTFEVDQLLKPGTGHRFARVDFSITRAVHTGPLEVEFASDLILQAERANGELLPNSYLVKVTGQSAFESPVWRINEIFDVVVDPIDRGDHSGYAPLG